MAEFSLYDYEIIEQLGVGGMAKVYKAKQIKLDRLVVIKELSPALYRDPSFRERFAREAKICAKLSHPNIVQIYDVVVKEDGSYLSIEYVDGGDLEELLKKPIEIVTVYQLVKEMCSALDYAHSKNVIHRDVKPKNILVRSNGSFVLADFGIAKSSDMETQMTVVGTTVGSPKYMSPEQAQGHPVDGRSDFYSLGVVLYEVLTGHVPFNADSSVALALKHMNEDVPALPDNFADLNPFFRKILAKKPDDRFKNGQEIVDYFLKWLHQADVNEVTLTAQSESRITEIYSNSLLSKVSQINKAIPKNNRIPSYRILLVSIAATIATVSLIYYFNSVKSIEKQQYVNEQLSYAYDNLQKSQLAESLINFRNVLVIDEDNEVAKKSIGIGRKLLIEDLNKHLASNDFTYIDSKLSVLSKEFLEEPDFSEFLIKYQNIKTEKENNEKLALEMENLIKMYNLAIENELIILPEGESAAHYLNQILKLKPDDRYFLDQKKALSVKAVGQMTDVLRVLGAKEAKKLVDAFIVYFDVNNDYQEIQSRVVQALELEDKKNRTLKLTEQKRASELAKLESSILNRDSRILASYKGIEYFKDVDSYFQLGGGDREVINIVTADINTVVDELNSIHIDLFDVDASSNIHKYNFIEQHKELQNPYRKMVSLISFLRNQSLAYVSFLSYLETIKKNPPMDGNWVDSFFTKLSKVKKMKLSPAADSNVKNEVAAVINNAIEKSLSKKNLAEAKRLVPLAKLHLSEPELQQLLPRVQRLEQDLQNLAVNQQQAAKEVLAKFDRLINSGALFTPAGASAAEYLMGQKSSDVLSSAEFERATKKLFQQVSEQLFVLIEKKQLQEFQKLYSVVESYFSELSASTEIKTHLEALKNRSTEIETELTLDLKQFETALGAFEFQIKAGDLDNAWASFMVLESKYRNRNSQNYITALETSEKSLLTLLCNRIDQFILDYDKKSAEALFKKGLQLFPTNTELLSREQRIKQLRDKEVKILSF